MASRTSVVGKMTAVPPSDLHLFHDNPREGDVPAIMASLRRHDQYAPITVNLGTHTDRPNEVLKGNHTTLAFRRLAEQESDDPRWRRINVFWVDVDDDMCERIVTADNRTGQLGGFDQRTLIRLLDKRDGDLEGLGYTESDVAELRALQQDNTALPPINDPISGDPDDVPDPPAKSEPLRTAAGQRWRLGPHRLLVGDGTDLAMVGAWLGESVPDVVWTDPPYGVGYVGKTVNALTIKNDGASDNPTELVAAAAEVWRDVCRPGAPFYVTAPPGPQFADFAAGLAKGGVEWRQTLVWVKNAMVLGRSDYHYQHEPVFYGFVTTPTGVGRLGRGGPRWFGDDGATTALFHDKPAASETHPTMKPVSLIAECLGNSCGPGDLVLDTFAGSGSTMIAAHTTNRRAALVEVDPVYAQVILMRYEKATGDKAMLETD